MLGGVLDSANGRRCRYLGEELRVIVEMFHLTSRSQFTCRSSTMNLEFIFLLFALVGASSEAQNITYSEDYDLPWQAASVRRSYSDPPF